MDGSIRLRKLHDGQRSVVASNAKRRVLWMGRRWGKTTLVADIAVNALVDGRRVLYAVPTQEQIDRFWFECKRSLADPVEAGALYKNESRHIIEVLGTEARIRAKTAWNADTLRGDYADLLVLDEFQFMNPDAWKDVGAPMLLDNNGDAIFIFTGRRGTYYAKELYNKAKEAQAQAQESGEPLRWQVFRGPSHENPHISEIALADITQDMTDLGYRIEILAEDIEDDPAALWNRQLIAQSRVTEFPDLIRVVCAVDPPGKRDGAEAGIVVAGLGMYQGEPHAYVLADRSMRGTPAEWSAEVVVACNLYEADMVIGESNFGGEMVEHTVMGAPGIGDVRYQAVHASRGKTLRAEPIVARYERGMVHHVGELSGLEDEQCNWVPNSGMPSPNRIDACVFALTELLIGKPKKRVKSVKW